MNAARSDGQEPSNTPGALLTEFFAMGGYAVYVWPAYGFAALVLIAMEIEQVRRVARPARASRPKLQPAPRAERPAGAEIAGRATE